MMSFIACIGGLGFVGLNTLHRLKNPLTLRVSAMVLILVVIWCCYKIIETYKIKAGWYELKFYPPQGYVKGPLNRDQGISF